MIFFRNAANTYIRLCALLPDDVQWAAAMHLFMVTSYDILRQQCVIEYIKNTWGLQHAWAVYFCIIDDPTIHNIVEAIPTSETLCAIPVQEDPFSTVLIEENQNVETVQCNFCSKKYKKSDGSLKHCRKLHPEEFCKKVIKGKVHTYCHPCI